MSLSRKHTWFARYRGAAHWPTHDATGVMSVRVALDNEPDRNVWLQLNVEDAQALRRTLSAYLAARGVSA